MEWMGRPWQGCLAGWNHIVRVKLTFGRYGRAPLFSCSLFDDGQYAVHSTSREEVSECNSIIPHALCFRRYRKVESLKGSGM